MNRPVFGNAKYIKAQELPSAYAAIDPAPLFRKEFTLPAMATSAYITVQSPGFACVYVNGHPMTEDKFISPVSDYRKILWYHSYDVTALLRPGKNVIGVIAGNGFFNESFESAWHYPQAPWRDAPQFLLSLTVDGEIAVVSDESWKVSREHSHIVYNHLRSGETADMRKFDPTWMAVGYDDSDWQNALLRQRPVTGELRLTPCQPVREAEAVRPVSVTEVEGGYLVDFGVTLSGYVSITLQAPRGQEVRLLYAEELDENNQPKHNYMNAPWYYPESPFQTDTVIASGGVDTFKPSFSYYGFRYVRIEGLPAMPLPDTITAYFLHQDVARRSTFESGDPVLNYIFEAGIRSTYSNMFWSLTDCPTREKLGWTNDAQASAEQTLINFDIVPLYEKWYEDIKAAMAEDGSMPGIVPSAGWGFNHGPVCDCLLYELPYRVYQYTGDSRMLTDALPYLERYAVFLEEKIAEKFPFPLSDWQGNGNSPLIPLEFILDFYLIKALNVTALAHKLAGDDAAPWQQKLSDKTQAFLNTWLDADDRATVDEQTSVAMMLCAGLYRDKQVLAEQLKAAVDRENGTITCGMVGIQYLNEALTDCGYAALAYRLITQSEPGYKTWYRDGATTLWEVWDGKDVGSHNHHMFSNVLAWLHKSLLGICVSKPGFEELTLSPHFIEQIGFVRGSADTVRGRIEAAWELCDDHFVYTVTVPEGIKATYCEQPLSPGKHRFEIKKER